MKRFPPLIISLVFLLAALAEPALAWPGDPDVTFGSGNPPGSVVAELLPNGTWPAAALVVQSDGRIVAAGDSASSVINVARYLKDGSPDPGFGDGGQVKTEFANGLTQVSRAVVQGDGKILVAGAACPSSNVAKVIVIRHLPDGTPDPAFGNAGIVRAGLEGASNKGLDLALLSDGKILVLGMVRKLPPDSTSVTVLYRFLPDGSPDQSFGTGGSVEIPGPLCYRMAVQADGRIVIGGGEIRTGQQGNRFVLFRRMADGSPDLSFGAGGKVMADPAALPDRFQGLTDLAVHSDGKVLVAANTSTPAGSSYDFLLARFHADGSPDLSFNGTGLVLTDFPPDPDGETDYLIKALAVQSDGKAVVAGSAGISNGRLMTARFLADGTPDPGFGTGGMAVGFLRGLSGSMALQPDGGIVAGGLSLKNGSGAFSTALTRFRGGEPRQGLGVEKPDGTPMTFRATVDMGEAVRGSTRPLETTLTLRNYGSVPASAFSASFLGPGASAFTLVTPLPAVLAGQSSTPLTVRYAPAPQVSTSDAWLAITSGDPPSDSAGISLRAGTVAPVAELTLSSNGASFAPDSRVEFGPALPGHPLAFTFTLKNTGNIDLLLQGASLTGEGTPNDFTVGTLETDVLAPGASTTLPLTFSVMGAGERTATLRIVSTDTFKPDYELDLHGRRAEGLDEFRLTHFGTLLNEGPAADLSDPDRDGILNLLEYAFLTNPNTPGGLDAEVVKNGDDLEYTITRPSRAAEVVFYKLDRSDTAMPNVWYQSGYTLSILSDDGTRQRVRFSIPAGTESSRFLRMRVVRK